MDKKCSKYEGLFVFSDKETLEKHLAECEECREEQAKMDRVSELLGEVKFYYRKKERKLARLRVAYAMLFVCLFTCTFGFIFNEEDLMDTLKYGDTFTAEELGFPVDSYGLIAVDDEF